jgi:trk system potassium uptake protein
MRVLVVGAGKVGSHLVGELIKDGHVVSVIEQQPEKAQRLGETSRALVFEGDGTDVNLLKTLDIRRIDWALAVTGRDEDNLVACQLARTLGASHVLARLNDPSNRKAFNALGVPVVAVTDLMVQVISREVELVDLARVALLGRGQVSLVELEIPEGHEHQPLATLKLPQPSILVTVVRDEQAFVPGADTVLIGGDKVLAVTAVDNETDLRDALCGPIGGNAGA